ncbi:hypothetical protein G7048_03430 [Diaphorobacter sp. HDW4B]|uniref:hypothetical protein n=1 Tax=Diaphorobacter sp. HDW4B TaxID=2714925 RepID=UPI00140A6745|nr:hypothetical protein [Diaphorobacter sp. HDW4B]QIL69508.1 hypothetical protein G7048_03430 [Diaphorobacter sp. HDW4B]
MSFSDKTIFNIRPRARVLPDVQSRSVSDDDYVFRGPNAAAVEQQDKAREMERVRARRTVQQGDDDDLED